MSLNFITGPDLFLANNSESISISQVDESVPGPSASGKENRRKRQLSVSTKLIIFCIIRVLTSENRKPNFHLLRAVLLGLASPAPLGHRRSLALAKTLNRKAR